MTTEPGNNRFLKRLNRLAVINKIREYEPVSRQQLSKLTGLTPSSVTLITRELLNSGFIREVGPGRSSRGRKPVKLSFNNDAAYVIGIELTRYEPVVGIADLRNSPVEIKRLSVDMTLPEDGLPGCLKRFDGSSTVTNIGTKNSLASVSPARDW